MQNIYILQSAKLHANTSTYVDRGTVQSLVKIADDPAIMGTVDNKKPINVRFWGGGLEEANATFALLIRHNVCVAPYRTCDYIRCDA